MATVQGLYLALFGRPADPLGLAYFNSITNNGQDLSNIASLTGEAEYQDRFTGMSNVEIVNSIYQSLFGRDADLAGLTFFVNQLNTGAQNINSIAINILDGAQGADLTVVTNKLAAADTFTTALDTGTEVAAYAGETAADAGRAYLAGVTADPDTVPDADEAQTAIDAIVLNPTNPTFVLTPGVDFADQTGSFRNGGLVDSDFTLGTGNQTVSGSSVTATAGDVVSDNVTTDEDIANLSVAGATAAGLNNLTATNIENINLNLANGSGAFSMATYSGVQSVNVAGTIAANTTLSIGAFAASGVTAFSSTATGGFTTAGNGLQINDNTANQAITVNTGATADWVNLGNGANTINTGNGDDIVAVGTGNNTITTGEGDDAVTFGATGNNTIDLGDGVNSVNGGNGNTTVTSGGGTDTVNLGNGTNTIDTGAAADSINVGNGANTINSGDGNDTIVVGNGANTIDGGAGNDTITVGTGANTVLGGDGNDTITLSTGSSVATGGAGTDDIDMGAGTNVAVFGAGDSTLVFATFDQTTNFTTTVDDLDFNLAAGSGTNFAAGAVGTYDQAGVDAGLIAANNAFDGTVIYYAATNAAGTVVFVDADANGEADYAVGLTGTAAIVAGDIIA